MLSIGILASHQGTNFQAIADACADGRLDATVTLLICNNSTAPVMARAAKAGIPVIHLSSQTHPDNQALDASMCRHLQDAAVQLVVLAGYMKKLGPITLSAFEDRIINVHPSLLPRHGGPGYYGARVHEAVIRAGDTETGATVHLVNGEYDAGDILLQEKIQVRKEDTAEMLAERLHPIEHRLLLEAVRLFPRGRQP